MKKQPTHSSKKLSLSKETLLTLSEKALRRVQGGDGQDPAPTALCSVHETCL